MRGEARVGRAEGQGGRGLVGPHACRCSARELCAGTSESKAKASPKEVLPITNSTATHMVKPLACHQPVDGVAQRVGLCQDPHAGALQRRYGIAARGHAAGTYAAGKAQSMQRGWAGGHLLPVRGDVGRTIPTNKSTAGGTDLRPGPSTDLAAQHISSTFSPAGMRTHLSAGCTRRGSCGCSRCHPC